MQSHVQTASVGEQGEDRLLDATVTVDGAKIVVNLSPGECPLDKHPALSFTESTKTDTGEVCMMYAKYQGLHFIQQGGKRWVIKGSLHKFYNEGRHNANDFTYRMLLIALARLEREFGLCLEKCYLENLETGVNLHPMLVSLILDSLIWQGKGFIKEIHFQGDCDFRGVEHTQYFSAYYDKGRQFPEFEGTLRIEKKIRRSREFRPTGIRTLADLIQPYCLGKLAEIVEKMWNDDTLMFDVSLLDRLSEFDSKEQENIKNWTNTKIWKRLTGNGHGKNAFRTQWKKAEKFQEKHSGLKTLVSQAIASKLAHIKEYSSQQPRKEGIFTPPIAANKNNDNNCNQGIIRGEENTLVMKRNGNSQGLYKETEFPHFQPSGLDSLTREQLFDALGMDENDPY